MDTDTRKTGLKEKWGPKYPFTLLWEMAVHPVTFVVLAILWCADLAIGSIAAYFNDPRFWQKMDAYPFNLWLEQVAPKVFPASLWVYILVVLSWIMVLSLLLCTINWFARRRKKLKGYAEVLVHLGFLLIFAGFVIGSAFGTRTRVVLQGGEKVPVPGMGLSLELSDFDIVESPQGHPVDTHSSLVVFAGGEEPVSGKVRTNHPMIRGSIVVYPPEDYGFKVTGGVVGTSASGALALKYGEEAVLADGRSLVLGGILQAGQRQGSAVGPGILVVMKNGEGNIAGSAYMSKAPGMRDRTMIDGVRVTLGELTRAARGIYRVHRDPGVWLVIVGTVILALGTVWALAVYFGIVPGEGN